MSYPMPFGKYKNWPIDRLPRDYVGWLFRNVELDDATATAFEKVYKRKFKRRNPWADPSPGPKPSSSTTAVGPTLQSMRRKFASKYHPDRPGGSREIMRAVNVIFDELGEVLR